MITKHLPFALAVAVAFCVSSTARADTPADTMSSPTKLTITPAVLTHSGDQVSAPVTEVQYRRRAYRRGWGNYGSSYYRYPSYSYGYNYYPRSSYGYYPYSRYSSYGWPSYGGYYGSYYGSYYPRYYTGYRGGLRYYSPGFSGSFYW
jgi:hypothetical protein